MFVHCTYNSYVIYSLAQARFHGGKSDTTHRLAEELVGLRPVALLCEATRLRWPRANLTEEEAYQNCLKVTQQAQSAPYALNTSHHTAGGFQ